MKRIFITIFLALVAGTVLCQNSSRYLQFIKQESGSAISIKELKKFIKDRCKANGGEEAFDKLMVSVHDLEDHLRSSFNASQIGEELDIVKPSQKFGIVFKKYCDKVPTLQLYIRNVSAAAERCLAEEEQPSLTLLLNVTDTAVTTVCVNDGDRLSMFMEDNGPACLLSQESSIEQCINQTLSPLLPTEFSYDKLLLLSTYFAGGCGNYLQLRRCVVKALEQCEDFSTAILVGAFFSIIHRVLPCTTIL